MDHGTFLVSQLMFFMGSAVVANIAALPRIIAHVRVPFLWRLWGGGVVLKL